MTNQKSPFDDGWQMDKKLFEECSKHRNRTGAENIAGSKRPSTRVEMVCSLTASVSLIGKIKKHGDNLNLTPGGVWDELLTDAKELVRVVEFATSANNPEQS